MARAQTVDADDIPMIEEQVDTGLAALMDSYRATYNPYGEKQNDLLKRFTLLPDKPLPEYDHAYAKAYAAIDDFSNNRNAYAMVCDNSLPYRDGAIAAMLGNAIPHMVPIYGAGTVNCSHLNESRYVLFMEMPEGQRLSDAMVTRPRLHEHMLIDHVMQPTIRALAGLRTKKVSHGNLCPQTIYVGEGAGLAECYSMPPGTIGHHMYRPLEHLMCDTLGHGDATEQGDVYALGILAYELLYGVERFRRLPREEYIKLILSYTTYQVFANNRDFSDAFQDFFRGTLNDNPAERWSLDQVIQWLGGKRFNMIAPSPPKEAARPFAFGGENFFSRHLLANAFHRNWREAVKDIKTMKLERWCETSLHRPEMGERVERALRIAGEASTEKHVSDMMSRIIAILDPTGPIRSMSLAIRPDAIGLMLADMLKGDNHQDLSQLLGMIETDVSSYWSELSEANKPGEMSQIIWKLQRMRPFLKSRSFGFGVERIMYDLNPSLPCQSHLLKPYHLTTAIDTLKTLDALAHNLAPDTSFNDRHMAAFVASKISLSKELTLDELRTIPKLATNDELVVMKILARAQLKVGKQEKLHLVGLCTWAAMRIEKMLDEIHNRILRKRLKLQLKRLASTGDLNELLVVIINQDIASRDYDGFAKAIALHQINQKKIERYENPRLIDHYAQEMGRKMAMIISYTALTITSYVVLSNLLGY